MKASLVDNGLGKGRKCIELSAESDEELDLLERFRIGYGALGHSVIVAGTNDAVCVDVLAATVQNAPDGRTVILSDEWEIPENVQR